jgi:mono/diheme cytochrome c family protein
MNIRNSKGWYSMHGDGSGTRLTIGAVPGKLSQLRALLMLLLGASLVCAVALAEPAAKSDAAKPAAAQVKDTNPADLVGAEVCATCHDSEAKGFIDNPHSKLALEHGKTGVRRTLKAPVTSLRYSIPPRPRLPKRIKHAWAATRERIPTSNVLLMPRRTLAA